MPTTIPDLAWVLLVLGLVLALQLVSVSRSLNRIARRVDEIADDTRRPHVDDYDDPEFRG